MEEKAGGIDGVYKAANHYLHTELIKKGGLTQVCKIILLIRTVRGKDGMKYQCNPKWAKCFSMKRMGGLKGSLQKACMT